MPTSPQQHIKSLTGNILRSTIDISLWILVYCGHLMLPQRSYGAAFRAAQAADEFLAEINAQTLTQALANSRKKGLVQKSTIGKQAWPQITQAGLKRLYNTIPQYDIKRAWDKRMYLITYDISEKKKVDRNILREYLKRIGCGILQKSVWITPYNPRDVLRSFIKQRKLDASVIVSDIGKDGSVGIESLEQLLVRVYKLHELNARYEEFLKEVENAKQVTPSLIIQFQMILADDPQLPFTLLPDWWLGDIAWKKIEKHRVK